MEVLFQQVGTVDHIFYTAGDKLATIPFQEIIMEYFVKAGQLRFFTPLFVLGRHPASRSQAAALRNGQLVIGPL